MLGRNRNSGISLTHQNLLCFLVICSSPQQILENIIPARLEGIMGILVEPLGWISGVPQL